MDARAAIERWLGGSGDATTLEKLLDVGPPKQDRAVPDAKPRNPRVLPEEASRQPVHPLHLVGPQGDRWLRLGTLAAVYGHEEPTRMSPNRAILERYHSALQHKDADKLRNAIEEGFAADAVLRISDSLPIPMSAFEWFTFRDARVSEMVVCYWDTAACLAAMQAAAAKR